MPLTPRPGLPVPAEPLPMSDQAARCPKNTQRVYIIAQNPPMGADPSNLYDFEDGSRFCITREDHGGGEIFLHASLSFWASDTPIPSTLVHCHSMQPDLFCIRAFMLDRLKALGLPIAPVHGCVITPDKSIPHLFIGPLQP